MKIHNPENKSNIIPKAFSIFPLFAGLALINGDSLVFKILSILCITLAIYTFFFTKYERYLDTERKVTVKRISWLFFNSNTEESIKNYEYVVVSFGDTLPNSNLQSITSKITYDVVLVRKHASSMTHSGFGSLENFLLKHMCEDINDACRFATMIAELTGLPAKVENEVVTWLKYDPLI